METQRIQHVDCRRSEEENKQRCARCIIPGVIERESAQQLAAREEPGVQECKSAQRAAAVVISLADNSIDQENERD